MRRIDFRTLTKEDVECRVCSSTEKSISLLIYKNARVDMAILNDTVGMGWKREHNFKDGKNYCTVSIWDEENRMWVSREDCGVESSTEAEKGQSSDAFKRACFNWGIGVELYTGPKISIAKQDKDMYNGKVSMTFSVSELTISEDHKIMHIVIVDRFNNERFRWDFGQQPTIPTSTVTNTNPLESLTSFCSQKKNEPGIDLENLKRFFNYYQPKIASGTFKGSFNADKLWTSWCTPRPRNVA